MRTSTVFKHKTRIVRLILAIWYFSVADRDIFVCPTIIIIVDSLHRVFLLDQCASRVWKVIGHIGVSRFCLLEQLGLIQVVTRRWWIIVSSGIIDRDVWLLLLLFPTIHRCVMVWAICLILFVSLEPTGHGQIVFICLYCSCCCCRCRRPSWFPLFHHFID